MVRGRVVICAAIDTLVMLQSQIKILFCSGKILKILSWKSKIPATAKKLS
jgi:hypothetical protein